MRCKGLLITTIFGLVVTLAAGCWPERPGSRRTTEPAVPQPPKTAPAAKPEAQPAPALKQTIPGVEELNSLFAAAKEKVLNNDLKGAAANIREAAQVLKKEARGARAEAKEGLAAAAQEMEQLAGEVEKGAVTNLRRIQNAFGRGRTELRKMARAKAEAAAGKSPP